MYILVKEMLTNGLTMGLPLRAWIVKITHGVEIHWHSCTKTVPSAVVGKEVDSDNHPGHQRSHHYWFLGKSVKCKKYFLLLTSQTKFTLILEWLSYIWLTQDPMWLNKISFHYLTLFDPLTFTFALWPSLSCFGF